MNSLERNLAYRNLKQKELLQTSTAAQIAEKYAKEHGNWQKHRDAIFSRIEGNTNVIFAKRVPTEEELEIQEILKNY